MLSNNPSSSLKPTGRGKLDRPVQGGAASASSLWDYLKRTPQLCPVSMNLESSSGLTSQWAGKRGVAECGCAITLKRNSELWSEVNILCSARSINSRHSFVLGSSFAKGRKTFEKKVENTDTENRMTVWS